MPRELPGGAASRGILACGRLDSLKGWREALWAFAILRYLYNDLHLWIVGAGAALAEIEQFSRAAGLREMVHLLGPRQDLGALLERADVVWLPGESGAEAALDALAAGRPIVGLRGPALADMIQDEVDGLLVPPGQPVLLARKTAAVLGNPALAERLGGAARERAARDFAAADMVRAYACIYRELAA